MTWENLRRMVANKIAFLFPLFIFGLTTHVWPESIKSMNNTANRLTIMKMDENKGVMQKKKGPAKEPIRSLKNRSIRFYKGISYSDYGAIMGDIRPDVNFVKTLEEKKKRPLPGSLDKAIYCYESSQESLKDQLSMPREIFETKSSASKSGQSNLKLHPNGNKYFQEGSILATLKPLRPRREDLFRGIFMGFRFSFTPVSGHMFLDLNVNPSPDTGTGIIIPF